MTQEQLAEILNTTNKSVSKWENGYCLPDSSLFEPLCNILEISMNELFAGIIFLVRYILSRIRKKEASFDASY